MIKSPCTARTAVTTRAAITHQNSGKPSVVRPKRSARNQPGGGGNDGQGGYGDEGLGQPVERERVAELKRELTQDRSDDKPIDETHPGLEDIGDCVDCPEQPIVLQRE